MDITKYATLSQLSYKILKWMETQKFIHDPLTEEDLIGLKLLENVWWKKEILRAQLLKFSKKDQLRLLETAKIKTKWERYAYSRFRNLDSQKKLSMKHLINEIEMTFNFQLHHSQIQNLYKIRQQVYDQRRKAKKTSGKSTN